MRKPPKSSTVPVCVGCLYRIGWGVKRIMRHTGIPKTNLHRFARLHGLTDCFISEVRKADEDKRRKVRPLGGPKKKERAKTWTITFDDWIGADRWDEQKHWGNHIEVQRWVGRRNAARMHAKQVRGSHRHLSKVLRSRIYLAITRLTGTRPPRNRELRTADLLGCSVDRLRAHLELLWQPGMSWENYGEWHVDHVKPCASFDLSKREQQLECFHFLNLQPLWAHDNLTKHARVA